VCLPDGILYGRVPAGDGPRLADAYVAGLLDPALLRGRSAWPAPAQVAEQELRLRIGLTGIHEIQLIGADVTDAQARVTLATIDGSTHRFDLRAEPAHPPRPTSCRADELEEPEHWRVV